MRVDQKDYLVDEPPTHVAQMVKYACEKERQFFFVGQIREWHGRKYHCVKSAVFPDGDSLKVHASYQQCL